MFRAGSVWLTALVVLCLALGWTASVAYSEEAACIALGANCICSEPMNTTSMVQRSTFWYDPADSTPSTKECRREPSVLGSVIERGSGAPVAIRNDAVALAALPAGHQIHHFIGGPDGHTGIFFMGHNIQSVTNVKRLTLRWYRYFSSNFQFSSPDNTQANPGITCHASKIGQGTGNMILDTHHEALQQYGMFTFGWVPNIDCCGDGSPGGNLDTTGQALTMNYAKWRGKWWRFEWVIVNPAGGASPNGLRSFVYVKDVTTPASVEFKAIDSSVADLGTFAEPWTQQAATGLTPPSPVVGLDSNNFRQDTCAGWSAVSHMMMAAWSVDSGQRIGAATEIEGGGGGGPVNTSRATLTGSLGVTGVAAARVIGASFPTRSTIRIVGLLVLVVVVVALVMLHTIARARSSR